MNTEITWVESDGGPHILIEKKYLKLWKGFIVVINYISDYFSKEMTFDTLYNEFNKISDEQFIDTHLIYQVTEEELYLLAACDFGCDWHYNYCKFHLLSGNYKIKIIEEYIFNDSSFRLFKFYNSTN